MEISLVTEATYPFHPGGVSVWCDQIVRGLPAHIFDVVAIGSGDERLRWQLPANVRRLQRVPLWAPAPRRTPVRAGMSATTIGAFGELLAAMDGPPGNPGFVNALRMLLEPAQHGELTPSLRSVAAVDLVLSSMHAALPAGRAAGTPPAQGTLGDAMMALTLLEHFLRPLGARLPRADLIHATANGLGVLVALGAQWSFGTPLVLTEHGIYLRERYLDLRADRYPHHVRRMLLAFFRQLGAVGYQQASVIAPVSVYNSRWELATGAHPSRIRPIYNGVDISSFPAAGEPDEPVLTWVGRIDPLKDIETLLRAFAEVRQVVPGARLRMFGPTPPENAPYRHRCEQLHRELGLGGSAVFEGLVSPVASAYGAGQVFVMTSISEGFPFVLIEAMAVGRPTVSTAVGGCAEAAGDAGIVVPPRDPHAVASACAALLTDTSLRRRLGEAARRRVLAQFRLDQCLGRYDDLYHDVVHGLAGTRPTDGDRTRLDDQAGRGGGGGGVGAGGTAVPVAIAGSPHPRRAALSVVARSSWSAPSPEPAPVTAAHPSIGPPVACQLVRPHPEGAAPPGRPAPVRRPGRGAHRRRPEADR